MSDLAIRVEGLSKQFRIGAPERYRTLRDTLTDTLTAPFRFMRNGVSMNAPVETIWALRDISFDVKAGEVVGIIGRNGSGKSTLLKILSRITEPTEGHAEIHGRVGSLLEVGTGFHPELTGRENVFLNGAILGMNRAEIQRKFDEIVAFSEVDKFIDTPVKHYSSGMYLRLAFAVAAHMEPKILIIDEVLAVGDAAFQKKCLGKMSDVAGEGRTVLFVSHNMGAIQGLCHKCVWLRAGEVASVGESGTVIRQYLGSDASAFGSFDERGRSSRPNLAVVRNAWLEKDHVQVGNLMYGDEVDLVVEIDILQKARFGVELLLRQADGIPVAFAPSGLMQDFDFEAQPGRCTVRAALPPACLAVGGYSIDVALAESGVRLLDNVESGVKFHIDSAAFGRRHWVYSQSHGHGHMLWDVKFEFTAESRHIAQTEQRAVELSVEAET
jgi:ABC-type polysaccharide/polyol phosphate transport system ATPase subunit